MWLRLGLVVLGLTSCIEDHLVECGDLACPTGSVCTASGCATREQLTVCSTLIDGDACNTHAFPGLCVGSVCQPVVCGDGKIVGREVCDDHNQIAGDGCSADCVSNETCGNDYIDAVLGEQCDEGLRGLARDGCTSTCTPELDAWFDISPALPTPRSAPMAYDKRRHQVVMFGSTSGSTHVETWEWDSATWRLRHPAISPPPRIAPAMTYDADRGRVILFGGYTTSGPLDDTWEYDGITWTQRMPPESPGPHGTPTLVYDPVRHEVVLFGSGSLLETWVWDGTTWTLRPAADAPNIVNIAMAWDAQTSRVLLFSGSDRVTWAWNGTVWSRLAPTTVPSGRDATAMASTPGGHVLMYGGLGLDDTWEWINGDWVQRTSAANAGMRGFHSMVLDSDRASVMLFGGVVVGDYSNELYEWNGATWGLASPPLIAPPSESWASAVYQPLTGRTLMFGGYSNDVPWEWDGMAWVMSAPATRPAPRPETALAATRDRVVLFGGRSGSTGLDDTWEWDGTAWTQKVPAQRPPARYSAHMAYDAKRDRVILFGGAIDDASCTNDTWEWDGVTWTQRSVAQSPPPRRNAVMAYDAVRERIVLFGGDDGGYNGAAKLHDTWEWDGAGWTEMSPAIWPPTRMFAAAAYDAARGTVIMFGGTSGGAFDDTWEWDGTTWSELHTVIAPAPRAEHVMVYDAVRGELVVFGGATPSDLSPRNTQAHRFTSRAFPADACVDIDTDGDGLVGCDDPDCWGRCTPLCPPGAACDPAAPHCGDGTCSVLEDHRLCPADCAP